MPVFKVSLLSGTDRTKGYRRRVIWSGRVEARSAYGAEQAARAIHEAQAARFGRRSFWESTAAVGRIKVEEVR